ncbi:hypothetical protein SO802_002705 [Lithocarpus litseifolius]|uniref:Uncharacterized protein n=1 Tax=Lithocarpus litseifolius TaxID=425828 RepID=A0AAW2E3M7_9ROSI
MAKTNALRREIACFYLDEQKKFYESWEISKDLILKCPHHGFETWRLVDNKCINKVNFIYLPKHILTFFNQLLNLSPPRQQSSLMESLKTFMQSTSQVIQEMKSSTHLNTQAISKLENQVGQLATQVGEREKGKFPNQPIPNQKRQYAINGSSSSTHAHESVQSITTLKSRIRDFSSSLLIRSLFLKLYFLKG